ncbi:MAG: peptidyl-prolyl cis-trans isomerase, partial [Phycisphaerae bacterium]|nr:peptidyl-prolyl cis-trans isomerase [Phycisphaerae bacterium]
VPASRPVYAPPPPPLTAPPGALHSDILLVNSSVLSVSEVLYALEQQIAELRSTQTPAGFREQVERLIRRQVQQEIGSLLLYEKATKGFNEQQWSAVDRVVTREVDRITALRYGDSPARLDQALAAAGLTREQFRAAVRRGMVVRQYARELLLPRITPRREELLSYYRAHADEFSSPELRELLMIEAPFERFLPSGLSWEDAPEAQQARARLQALRHIRAAHAALAGQSFEDVARAYSRGMHAESGGSWGMLGRALQPPYDAASALVFDFSEGQISEPIECATGWVIVKCGRIAPAKRVDFADAQDQIREALRERKFGQELAEYVFRLAEKATIVGMDTFVTQAVRRAVETGDATAAR